MAASKWFPQQLVAFLEAVWSATTEAEAGRMAVERAAETLDAEIAAIVRPDRVVAVVGYPGGDGEQGLEFRRRRAGCAKLVGLERAASPQEINGIWHSHKLRKGVWRVASTQQISNARQKSRPFLERVEPQA